MEKFCAFDFFLHNEIGHGSDRSRARLALRIHSILYFYQHPLFSLPSCFFIIWAFAFGACIIFEDYTAEILLWYILCLLPLKNSRGEEEKKGEVNKKKNTICKTRNSSCVNYLIIYLPNKIHFQYRCYLLGGGITSSYIAAPTLGLLCRIRRRRPLPHAARLPLPLCSLLSLSCFFNLLLA